MQCKEEKTDLDEEFTWTRCMWKRMRDNATCLYKYHRGMYNNVIEIHDVCNGSLDGGLFYGSEKLFEGGENNVCGINLPRVLEADGGWWTCKMDYYNMTTQPLNQCTTNAEVFLDVNVIYI